jgi:hypothetical protein
VLYELDRGWEFGLIARVLLQNYELIRLALIEYAEGGVGPNGTRSLVSRGSGPLLAGETLPQDAVANQPWQRDPTGW